MVIINEGDGDNHVVNESMIEIKKIKNKITKMVIIRDSMNVTTRENANNARI